VANRSFEDVVQFKYLGTTYKNCVHEVIKSRLNSGNACYRRFSILSSRPLSRNARVKIYKP
jgi:hypothetical protein